MSREIIAINEELCDGCGDCVIGCSEGAIRIVDGKAKLVKAEFCDGFGDCVGVCPTGALKVIRREAPAFDDAATRRHLLETRGIDAVRRYEEAQARHEHPHGAGHAYGAGHAPGGGCPGSAQRDRREEVRIPVMQAQPMQAQGHPGAISGGCPGSAAREIRCSAAPAANPLAAPALIPSELGQWPVQLHLVQPGAPFFRDREMLVMSTCGPIASAEVHQRYLRNRSVVVACPKLDNTEPYAQKLAAIFQESSIPKVIVVIMEVPCCRGLSMLVEQALAMSGRKDLVVEEHVLTLDGEIKDVRELAA
ncbi:MAG: 4Fe-4S ferredoxin [Bacteroidota bacterium]|nr:4Fe-4S ferredoxin [Bacteroidota bacterium]